MFYLILFVFVLVGGILTLITLGNLFTMVHLVLFTWQAPALPLGLLLLLFFLLGALLLYLVAFLSARSDKREIGSLRKRVAQLEQQVKEQEQANRPNTMSFSPGASMLQMPGMFNPPRN
ncbi:MAG TPA: lipopolysaccharide assembly protein LapA domain-containing protein [Ktedonobacteraceae bacterium]|nr:lipopolysaccharide assembly protein LapA domain-containing protein [Ktedonobacteraceae bacterium]